MMQHKSRRSWRPAFFPVLCLLLGAVLVMMPTASAAVANEECAACHDEIGEAFAGTPHGVYLSRTSGAGPSRNAGDT